MMIRAGKPDIDSLNVFSEKGSLAESNAQHHLSRVITVQRQARNLIKAWIECARDIEAKSNFDVEFKNNNNFLFIFEIAYIFQNFSYEI
jgi:hypothetical protein